MAKKQKETTEAEVDSLEGQTKGPLVFISHDSRDAELAEAFAKLVKSVSAGMIKTFRSSDKQGKEGIDFGDEWYKRLMSKLQATSDVVCLFTKRSLDRPWILFEAGVAKGTLSTPVIGLALGVPLSRVSTGPFYQFQNMDDSEADLTKLVNQLARRVPSLELDPDVVKTQVQAFTKKKENLLKSSSTANDKERVSEEFEETAVAKLVEEMKSLPSRVTQQLLDDGVASRRRKPRRLHPMMIEDIAHMASETGDPVAILVAASLIREETPWLYELAMEVYRAVQSGDAGNINREMMRVQRFSSMMMHGPLMMEFTDRESHMFVMEFPRVLERLLRRTLERGTEQHAQDHPKVKIPEKRKKQQE